MRLAGRFVERGAREIRAMRVACHLLFIQIMKLRPGRYTTLGLCVGVFLPLAYSTSFVPAGMPVAEGCAGGGATAPPSDIIALHFGGPSDAPGPTPLPVGKDGFFVVRVSYTGFFGGNILDKLTFEVKNAREEAVAGTAAELEPQGTFDDYYVAWQSESELHEGDTLTATVTWSESQA
jgi:hypothetical protein